MLQRVIVGEGWAAGVFGYIICCTQGKVLKVNSIESSGYKEYSGMSLVVVG